MESGCDVLSEGVLSCLGRVVCLEFSEGVVERCAPSGRRQTRPQGTDGRVLVGACAGGHVPTHAHVSLHADFFTAYFRLRLESIW